MSELLDIFFDESFSSTDYVDAFLGSVVAKYSPNQVSKKSLKELSTKLSTLITHIDYYTDELTEELKRNFDTLERANSAVSKEDSVEVKRIQYYINILNNSITSLQLDFREVDKQLVSHDDLSIKTISDLKHIRSNMIKVLEVFELIHSITSGLNAHEITSEQFEQSLEPVARDLLQDSLESIETYKKQLKAIAPVFKGLGPFHTIYKAFIEKF